MSAGFPSITFILLVFLLQKLKEEIAEVFAEIECFQNAERQEAANNPGEQSRQVGQDGYSFVYKVSLLMLREQKTPVASVSQQGQGNKTRNALSPLRFLFLPG